MGFFDALRGLMDASTHGASYLTDLLQRMKKLNGTELRIAPGSPPQAMVQGRAVPLSAEPLQADECRRMCYLLFTDAQKTEFEKNGRVEFAFGVRDIGRCTARISSSAGQVSGVIALLR